jgi:competence protein ComEC
VRITNQGASAIDLTAWVLKDTSASHRYPFPRGFVLGAGASVTVRTGCGQDSATDLHWCNEGSAVWNNSGDTAFLLDPAGAIVDSRDG